MRLQSPELAGTRQPQMLGTLVPSLHSAESVQARATEKAAPNASVRASQSRAGAGPGPTTGQLELGVSQVLVPPGYWQRARPRDDQPSLVSCVVVPGFDFADFSLTAP